MFVSLFVWIYTCLYVYRFSKPFIYFETDSYSLFSVYIIKIGRHAKAFTRTTPYTRTRENVGSVCTSSSALNANRSQLSTKHIRESLLARAAVRLKALTEDELIFKAYGGAETDRQQRASSENRGPAAAEPSASQERLGKLKKGIMWRGWLRVPNAALHSHQDCSKTRLLLDLE